MEVKKIVISILISTFAFSVCVHGKESPTEVDSNNNFSEKMQSYPYCIYFELTIRSDSKKPEFSATWGNGKVPKYFSSENYEPAEKTHTLEVFDSKGKIIERFRFGLALSGFAVAKAQNSKSYDDHSLKSSGRQFYLGISRKPSTIKVFEGVKQILNTDVNFSEDTHEFAKNYYKQK